MAIATPSATLDRSDCPATRPADLRSPAPVNWATRVMVPVLTARAPIITSIKICRLKPTAEMASLPSLPTI